MDPDALILLRKLAERSPSEREDYYSRHAVPAEVRAQVESLLKAGDRTLDSFAGHIASSAIRALLEEQRTPTPAPSRTPLRPGAIGRYEIIRLLGRGGMSEVYLARDPMLERDIAVKLIAGELDGEVARRRLVREASAAGRLRHPNIVTIFDAGEHEGQPYIAMEYVAGETLRSLIRRQDPLPLGRRLELIEGACAGLAHAHRSGVVHLDIKPDNLIVDESGGVKVLDFGIARVLSSESLATRHVVGTLRYMSPEQVAGEPIDHRSDIFSLGSSLYELLTYLPAFAGSTKEIIYRIATGPVPRLIEVMPDIDPRLDAVVSRAMALEPSDRFGDVDELRAELARLREELDPSGERRLQVADPGHAGQPRVGPAVEAPITARAAASREEAAARNHRRRAALVVSALAVTVSVFAGFWLWRSPSPADAPPVTTPVSLETPAADPAREPEPPAASAAASDATNSHDVWRLLTLDDRKGVLDLLRPRSGSESGPSAERLSYDVLSAVNKSVTQSRATATATPGAASSEVYRLAEERLGSAKRLETARDPISALRLLWEASDLYARAVKEGGTNAAASSAKPEPRVIEATAAPPAALPSTRTTVTSLPQGSAQSPPPPESSQATRSAALAAEPAAPVVERRARSDTEGVVEALERYRSAYQSRDAAQVMQILPSLSAEQAEQLRKSFDELAAYDIEIHDARVEVQADAATARAMVVRRMTTRFGSAVANEVDTSFRLRRSGTGWVITDVTAVRSP